MCPSSMLNLDVKKRCVSVLVTVLPCCIAVTVYVRMECNEGEEVKCL